MASFAGLFIPSFRLPSFPIITPAAFRPRRASFRIAATYADRTLTTMPRDRSFSGAAASGCGGILDEYLERSKEMIESGDGGPPRWFTPLECGGRRPRFDNSPLLLYLPGIDGLGLGLMLHHEKLGEIFDIRCLSVPITDRTSFLDLVKLVEQTIMIENRQAPKKPIYLVGESLGGCLALAVAARNPDIDLVLILANPATSYRRSPLKSLVPILELMPDQLYHGLTKTIPLVTGDPLKTMMANIIQGLPFVPPVGELSQDSTVLPTYLAVLFGILPRDTLLWKLQMLESACAYVNSRLHAIKAQTLLLSSGKDQLLPSEEEGERLRSAIQKCDLRSFSDKGHSLFLASDFSFLSVLKATCFYRRGRYRNYIADYIMPTASEFNQIHESHRWFNLAFSAVMLSTLGNGKIVRGLDGIPLEGPVLFVGYHMLFGMDLVPLMIHFFAEKNILLRGIAHPMMFAKLKDGSLPDLSIYDNFRLMGATPVSATNFYRLFSSNSHILLFPGGVREALHGKGEEYKLFWPEQSEFIRMAVKFGAKIIPFGTVGEDDFGEVFFDYDDYVKIPTMKERIHKHTSEAAQLRTDASGDVSQQHLYIPGVRPKLPGRFYYLFGKPIETQGRLQELRDKEKSQELYLQVKSEVESSIAYLKEKREQDPYRNLLQRLAFQAMHGTEAEVPTFEL